MALQLSKIEAVKFGDFEVTPQMDNELRRRVGAVKIGQNNYDEAIEVLSRCFGIENVERVSEFMRRHMFYIDFIRLQTYLTQGESGLSSLNERMERILDEEMKEAMDKAKLESAVAQEDGHE